MPPPTEADLVGLISALQTAGVQFTVVGGVAAVLHGAGVTTLDLDIVPRRTRANAARLWRALESLDARLQDPAGRILRPRPEDFLGEGQIKLDTNLGPVDVLCTLHDGRDYDVLVHSSEILEGDLSVRVLDLPTLIEVKSTTGRAKDRVVLPILLRLIELDQEE